MRAFVGLFLVVSGLAFGPGSARAQSGWQAIGELHLAETRAVGQISLNLDSLRNRRTHYEIWERVRFVLPPEARRGIDLPSDNVPDRLTLWGVRCRSGTLARISWGESGSYTPRAEPLRFLLPGPDGIGRSIIDVACRAAAGRQLGDLSLGAPGENSPDVAPGKPLDFPPLLPSTGALADDED